jgi:hypothetical protein
MLWGGCVASEGYIMGGGGLCNRGNDYFIIYLATVCLTMLSVTRSL